VTNVNFLAEAPCLFLSIHAYLYLSLVVVTMNMVNVSCPGFSEIMGINKFAVVGIIAN